MTGTSNTETSRTHDIWPWEADAVSLIPRQILLIQTQWDWNSESVTGHLYCAKLPSCCWSITKKENHSCSWRAGTKTCPRGCCVLTKGGMESKQRKRRISSAWRGFEGFHRGCDLERWQEISHCATTVHYEHCNRVCLVLAEQRDNVSQNQTSSTEPGQYGILGVRVGAGRAARGEMLSEPEISSWKTCIFISLLGHSQSVLAYILKAPRSRIVTGSIANGFNMHLVKTFSYFALYGFHGMP